MKKNIFKTAKQWETLLKKCGVKATVAATWGDVFASVVKEGTFSQGMDEVDDFLGQVLHESGHLTVFSENLNYSAERLCAVWPKRFPTLADAQPYARNPVALANKVYAGRMGNKNPGDGYRYRGRGPIQLTGFDNYMFVGNLIGEDLVGYPERLEEPHCALKACIAWWEDRIPDSMLGDTEKVSKRVNGGLMGLAERTHITQLAEKAISEL